MSGNRDFALTPFSSDRNLKMSRLRLARMM